MVANILLMAKTAYKIPASTIQTANESIVWYTHLDRIRLIREGLPYAALEALSLKINIPIKQFLSFLQIPQTTYNKKKRELSKLDGRDSEIILILNELVDYGLDVFNGESEKFLSWLNKENLSLGGVTPKSLFDSLTGIQEVKKCLDRIEYGNFA